MLLEQFDYVHIFELRWFFSLDPKDVGTLTLRIQLWSDVKVKLHFELSGIKWRGRNLKNGRYLDECDFHWTLFCLWGVVWCEVGRCLLFLSSNSNSSSYGRPQYTFSISTKMDVISVLISVEDEVNGIDSIVVSSTLLTNTFPIKFQFEEMWIPFEIECPLECEDDIYLLRHRYLPTTRMMRMLLVRAMRNNGTYVEIKMAFSGLS